MPQHETLEISKSSDLVIIPTGQTKDDLRPAVELANDLANQGVPEQQIAFVLVKTTSDAEAAAALGNRRNMETLLLHAKPTA